MLKNSEGIIIKTVKYGESSIILDIFTRDSGIRSYIVSGVRSRKSKGRSSIVRVMNLVDFTAYEKNNQSISRIKEISFNRIYQSIPFDIVKGTIALFLIEILRKTIRGSESNTDLYDFIIDRFIHLDDSSENPRNFHLYFLIDLAGYLGFGITNNYGENTDFFNLQEGRFTDYTGNAKYLVGGKISQNLRLFLSNQNEININRAERFQLLKCMVDFYKYHIENFGELHSLEVLHSLFSK